MASVRITRNLLLVNFFGERALSNLELQLSIGTERLDYHSEHDIEQEHTQSAGARRRMGIRQKLSRTSRVAPRHCCAAFTGSEDLLCNCPIHPNLKGRPLLDKSINRPRDTSSYH